LTVKHHAGEGRQYQSPAVIVARLDIILFTAIALVKSCSTSSHQRQARHDRARPPQRRQHQDMPGLHQTGESQPRQDERQRHHTRLRDHHQLAP
jgi:hypothetical protein